MSTYHDYVHNFKKKSPKLAVFDIDGTLIPWHGHTYIWDFLIHDFGLEKWNSYYFNAFKHKQISYTGWHEKLFTKFKKIGINKEMFKKSIISVLPEMTQIIEFLEKISVHFKHMAILSGSLALALEIGQIPLSLFDAIYINKIQFDECGKISSWEINPYGGHDKKFEGLIAICKKNHVDLKQTIYIGDGLNDLYVINNLYKSGGIGYALPPLSKSNELLTPMSMRGKDIFNVETFLR